MSTEFQTSARFVPVGELDPTRDFDCRWTYADFETRKFYGDFTKLKDSREIERVYITGVEGMQMEFYGLEGKDSNSLFGRMYGPERSTVSERTFRSHLSVIEARVMALCNEKIEEHATQNSILSNQLSSDAPQVLHFWHAPTLTPTDGMKVRFRSREDAVKIRRKYLKGTSTLMAGLYPRYFYLFYSDEEQRWTGGIIWNMITPTVKRVSKRLTNPEVASNGTPSTTPIISSVSTPLEDESEYETVRVKRKKV